MTDVATQSKLDVFSAEYIQPENIEIPLDTARVVIADFDNLLKEDISKRITGTSEKYIETLYQLGNIEAWLLNYNDRNILEQQVTQKLNHVSTMATALMKARENHLNRINTEIANDVNRFYRTLNPEEGYGDVQLVVENRGMAIKAEYHGHKAHPIGFYSEGHLDALGISIFLAYIKRFSQARLLILDDVLMAIDADHRLRLGHLLNEEFSDYQIIITTHDKLWAEQLGRTIDNIQANQLFWNINQGVQFQELSEQQWNEYITLAQTDPEKAIMNCARDFEKFLNQMRYSFSLSVPAKFGDKYTIGDLNDIFIKWVLDKKIEHPDADFEAKIKKFQEYYQSHGILRNVAAAHYNEWAASLSSGEAGDFINLIKELVQLFMCSRCNKELVQYSMDSKTIICRKCAGKPNAPIWKTKSK